MKPSIQKTLVAAKAMLLVLVAACDNSAAAGPSFAGASAPTLASPAAVATAGGPSSAPTAPLPAATPSSTSMAASGAAGAHAAAGTSAAGAAGATAGAPAAGGAGSEAADGGMTSDGAASAGSSAPEGEIDPEDLFPPLSTPETRKPSPDNPAECPMTAPEDPVGDCLGLPIYINCVYGTYNCVCDWYHWLCFG